MELNNSKTQTLLDGQLDLWHTTFAFMKSMALKSAVDLRIADAIHHHGGAATLPQILTVVKLHPSKTRNLRRLMRVISTTNVFTIQLPSTEEGEPVYKLTPASQLLLSSQNPFAAMLLNPIIVSPFFELGTWFQRELPDSCIFKQKHGQAIWELTKQDATFDALVNDGLASDSQFILNIAIKLCAGAFRGISSLIDVGGRLGGAAQTISKAFPHVKCSVLELEHVVADAHGTSCWN